MLSLLPLAGDGGAKRRMKEARRESGLTRAFGATSPAAQKT